MPPAPVSLAITLALAALIAIAWIWGGRRFGGQRVAIAFVIFALTVVEWHLYAILAQENHPGEAEHIICGEVSATFQFRVLIPMLAKALSAVPHVSLPRAERVLMFLSLFAALALTWKWLRVWVNREGALLGLFIIAAVLPTTFDYWYCCELSELAFFTGGFLLLAARPKATVGFLALLALAMLNRETSVLLVWAAVATHLAMGRKHQAAITGLGGLAVVAIIYLAVAQSYGECYSHPLQISRNLLILSYGLVAPFLKPAVRFNILIVAGGLWPLALWRIREAPRFLRAALTTAIPLLALGFVFAYLGETRIFNPILPVLVALIAWQLAPASRRRDLVVSETARAGVEAGDGGGPG